MTQPVDLTDLRTMTDGDKEMETALFEEFYSSSQQLIGTMASNCTDGENESWRGAAHALKGSSYNLGAKELGDLCKEAQEYQDMPASEKTELLEKIKTEYAAVETYLKSVHA